MVTLSLIGTLTGYFDLPLLLLCYQQMLLSSILIALILLPSLALVNCVGSTLSWVAFYFLPTHTINKSISVYSSFLYTWSCCGFYTALETFYHNQGNIKGKSLPLVPLY
mmetsp:Transcript_37582/g.87612  ORF Transcript_37582/g.87612 Transcript_37582/m.87612 type:complete len:109 (-) Transcript_37582:255-581(-)